jgi:hypothetical protein
MTIPDRNALVARIAVGVLVVGMGLGVLAFGRTLSSPAPVGPDPCGLDPLLARLTPKEQAAARGLTQLVADSDPDPGEGVVDAAVQSVFDAVTERSHVCQIVGKTSLCANLRHPGSALAKQLASAAVRVCSASNQGS